ncbi:MAG TPA: hypothetical protein VNW29_04140, partial [Candidatus Sulfotelmatobacter sp.]|nr:hypothetical protein [Candidatus Sulfotelmatobacter sp.]
MKKIFLPLLVVVFIGVAASYIWFNGITKKIFIPHSIGVAASTNSLQQYFENKTAFTIVLLGYGGGNHDGAYLTDSIMAVHID